VRAPAPVAIVLLVVACGGSPNADPFASTTSVTANTSVPETTAVLPTTTTMEPTALRDGELMACLVGTWVLDVEAFERDFQAAVDPQRNSILVDLVSGGASLDFGEGHRVILSYDDLTFTVRLPTEGPAEFSHNEMVVTGEVTATYRLEGNSLTLSDLGGSDLVFRQWTRLGEGEPQENPFLFVHPLTLAMSPALIPVWHPGVVTLECDEEQLVVSARFDTPDVDVPPPTSWLRQERDE